MPKRKLSTVTTRTVKKARISTRRRRRSNGGSLPGDGTTFTLEMAIPRSKLSRQAQTFTILQSFAVQNWFTTSTTTPTYTYVSFSLSQLDQVASLQNLFDQYKFNSCEVWITPQVSSDINSRSGQYATVIDYDDSTSLVSFNSALDYSTCVVTPVGCGVMRRFVPHMAVAAYAPSAFTSFANTKPMWIDTSSSGVAHYGVKLAANPTNGSTQTFDLTLRFSVSFRCVR